MGAPNGRLYTYRRLVDSYRDGRKVKHCILGKLGASRPEEVACLAQRFASLVGIELSGDLAQLEVRGSGYFGALLLVEHLLGLLRLDRWVVAAAADRWRSFSVLNALKVMVCAHWFKSGSQPELAVRQWQQKLVWYPHRVEGLEYQHLLRSLPVLRKLREAVKEVRAIEVAVRDRAIRKRMKVPHDAERIFQAVGIRDLKGPFPPGGRRRPVGTNAPFALAVTVCQITPNVAKNVGRAGGVSPLIAYLTCPRAVSRQRPPNVKSGGASG